MTGRAERKSLDDLLALHPEGIEVPLDNFWDVNDRSNPDEFDRVVVSYYDAENNVSYSGVCILKTADGMSESDVAELKAYLRTAWTRQDPVAFLRPRGEEGEANIIEPPTAGFGLAGSDSDDEGTKEEDTGEKIEIEPSDEDIEEAAEDEGGGVDDGNVS